MAHFPFSLAQRYFGQKWLNSSFARTLSFWLILALSQCFRLFGRILIDYFRLSFNALITLNMDHSFRSNMDCSLTRISYSVILMIVIVILAASFWILECHWMLHLQRTRLRHPWNQEIHQWSEPLALLNSSAARLSSRSCRIWASRSFVGLLL